MDCFYEMSAFFSTAILAIDLIFSFVCVKIAGVKVFGQDTTVIYGESAILLCQLTETNDLPTHIIWRKKTEETAFFAVKPGDKTKHKNGLGERVQFIGNFAEKNGSIKLLSMRLQDEGIYTCIFNLFAVGAFETEINVTVFVPPDVNVKGESPMAGYSEAMLALCLGSNARPPAIVKWRLGDLDSLRTVTNQTLHPNGTATVVSYLYGAPYKHLNKRNIQCVVEHISLKEDLVLNYTINIHYPPESVVIIPNSATNAKEFDCIVDSNPKPSDYTWTRVNKSAPYYEGSKLPVPKSLTSEFNGLYICNASNKYGSSLGSLYVNVYAESSSVCWGLFSVLLVCAAAAVVVGVVMIKLKPEWFSVSQQNPDDARAREDNRNL